MDLKTLEKAIHDAAMAVRGGDSSQWDKLQDLRKQHRAAYGIPEAEAAPAAPKAPKADKKPAPKAKKEDAE